MRLTRMHYKNIAYNEIEGRKSNFSNWDNYEFTPEDREQIDLWKSRFLKGRQKKNSSLGENVESPFKP